MKKVLLFCVIGLFVISCGSNDKNSNGNNKSENTIKVLNSCLPGQSGDCKKKKG